MKIFQVEATGDGPGGICYHVMEVIGTNCYVLLGQRNSKANPNSVFIFDLINQNWTCLEHPKGNAPTPRSMAASCVVGKKIYVFGGYSSSPTNSENPSHVHHHDHSSPPTHVVYNGLYYFDTETNEWIHIENNPNGLWPDPRAGAQMWYCNGKMYLVGGCQGRSLYFSTLYEYTIESNTWKLIETTCAECSGYMEESSRHFNAVVHDSNQNECHIQKPERFCCFSANLMENEVFVFGGLFANEEMEHHQPSNMLFVLDMDTMEWRRPRMASENTFVPRARASHTMCPIGSCNLILTGGCDVVHNSDYDPHVYMLNVKEMKWYSLTEFFFGSHMPKLVGLSSVYCQETKQVFYLGGKTFDNLLSDHHFYRIDTTLVKLIHEHEYLTHRNDTNKNYGSTWKRNSLKLEKRNQESIGQPPIGSSVNSTTFQTREKRSKSSIITYSPIPQVDSDSELLELDEVKLGDQSSTTSSKRTIEHLLDFFKK